MMLFFMDKQEQSLKNKETVLLPKFWTYQQFQHCSGMVETLQMLVIIAKLAKHIWTFNHKDIGQYY